MEVLGLLLALAVWFFIWRFISKKLIAVFQEKAQNTTQNKIKAHLVGAVLGFVACIIIFAIIVPKDSAPNTDKKQFSCTVEQFIDNYNQSLTNLDAEILVSNENEDDNGEWLTIQLNSNKNIALVVRANNKSRYVDSLIFIGAGEGSVQSGVNIAVGATAVIMAFENPDMPASLRGEIVGDLGLSNGKLVEQGELKFERNSVQYTISKSDVFGIMLTAEPIATVTEPEPTVTATKEPTAAQPTPMTRDQSKAFAMTYRDAIYDAQNTITNSGNSPKVIKNQYYRLMKMGGEWPGPKEQPSLFKFRPCFTALNSYRNLIDESTTTESSNTWAQFTAEELTACEACLQIKNDNDTQALNLDFNAMGKNIPCINITGEVSKKLHDVYRYNIYDSAVCDSKIIDGDFYILCHPDGRKSGGLFLVECDGDDYYLYTVNGKAIQHAEAYGLNAERFTEYRDIPAILDEF